MATKTAKPVSNARGSSTRKKPATTDLRERRNRDAATKAQVEQDRLRVIVDMRAARAPWSDIAEQVGLSHVHCRRIYLAELQSLSAEFAEQLEAHREDVAQSLQLVLRRAMIDVLGADGPMARAQASTTALRALRQWCDLYGLNAPKRLEAKIDVTHTTPIDEELARLSEQLGIGAPLGD